MTNTTCLQRLQGLRQTISKVDGDYIMFPGICTSSYFDKTFTSSVELQSVFLILPTTSVSKHARWCKGNVFHDDDTINCIDNRIITFDCTGHIA